MNKMKTLFKKDPCDPLKVIDEIQCEWVNDEGVTCHIKHDGSACMIKNGNLYKRYDAKINKKTGKRKIPPEGAIPCCDPDDITGHWPHWTPVTDADKYHKEAFLTVHETEKTDSSTWELCGPKVNGNNETLSCHELKDHSKHRVFVDSISYQSIRDILFSLIHEGLVFHHPDGRMCKIRRKDFGIAWPMI